MFPGWFEKRMIGEYKKGGFATYHIIAQKIRLPKKLE